MNAWSLRLRELRRALVVVASDIAITDPAPEELARTGWRDGVSISDSCLMVHYYRTTLDGRIAFGKGGGGLGYDARIGASFNGPSPMEQELAARLRAVYPAFAAVPIAASWAGPIDRTVDGLPFFHALGRPDLLCGAGYSRQRRGTLPARRAHPRVDGARARRPMGALRPRPPSPLAGSPAEPSRYIGGRIVRSAVARKERAEEAGRRPTRIDRAVARLAPAGLVPLD